MFGELCSLCCGFPQQGLGAWGWCEDGGAWLDSCRAARFSRENAGPGGREANDSGRRETKVTNPGVQAGGGKGGEERGPGLASLPIELDCPSRVARAANPIGMRIRNRR